MKTNLDLFEYSTSELAQAAYVSSDGGLLPDLINEDCSNISDWVNNDLAPAVSEVSPAGQFRLDTNVGAAANAYCALTRSPGNPPNTFTIEIKTYFDSIGTQAISDFFIVRYYNTTWKFEAQFCSDGLFIKKAGAAFTEVGSDIVKHDGTAAWQIWRFQIDKTTESTATVEVFLDNVSQGIFDCDYEAAGGAAQFQLYQYGYTTDNMVTHLDYIKVATGLGTIGNLQSYSESSIKTQGSYSLKGIAKITDSLNDTLTRTVSPTISLAGLTQIKFDMYALRTGSNIKIGIHDSGGTTTEITPNILSSNTWQEVKIDLQSVVNANKDVIDSIIITIVNADSDNTFYLDNFFAWYTPKISMTS